MSDKIDTFDEGGSAKISFVLDGKRYNWEAEYDNDWLDLNILHKLGSLMLKRASGFSFVLLQWGNGGDFIVLCIESGLVERLRTTTGLDVRLLGKGS